MTGSPRAALQERAPNLPAAARLAAARRWRCAAAGGRGRRWWRRWLTVDGLSILKPPYGTISAVNLDRGEIVWQVPHGDTPDNVRNHPALEG